MCVARSRYAPSHCRVTHCPDEGSAEAKALGVTTVTRATDSQVFEHAHRAPTTRDEEREVAFAPAERKKWFLEHLQVNHLKRTT